MIRAIQRTSALQHPNLATEVHLLQKAFHPFRIEDAENEDDLREIERAFDALEFIPHQKKASEVIVCHPSTDLYRYAKLLSNALCSALVCLDLNECYTLPATKQAIFTQHKIKNSNLNKLRQWYYSHGFPDAYDEAYWIDQESMPRWIELLVLIARYDGSAPEYIFINPMNDCFLANICKYGNIHFYFYDSTAQEQVVSKLIEAGLVVVEGQEYDRLHALRSRKLLT